MGTWNWDVFGNIVITALVTFTFTSIFGGLVIYKVQKGLDHTLARKLEELKAALTAEIQQTQVRFSATYKRREETVIALQSKLSAVERCFKEAENFWTLLYPDSQTASTSDLLERTRKVCTEYEEHANERMMYLPIETASALWFQMRAMHGVLFQQYRLTVESSTEVVRQEIPNFLAALEKFRETLGRVRSEFREVLEGEKAGQAVIKKQV